MKQQIFRTTALTMVLVAGLFMTACQNNDSSNAASNDTVSAPIEPQPDNATVRPDTMQTQIPQDSAMRKDSTK